MVTFFERVAAWRETGAGAEGNGPGPGASAPEQASGPAAESRPRTRDDHRRGHDGTADDGSLGIAIASHPPDAERIRFFEKAAAE